MWVIYSLAGPGKHNTLIMDIDDELSAYHELLDCTHIHIVSLPNRPDIAIIHDDEGKINGREPNLRYGNDVLVGPLIFTGVKGEDLCELSDEQIEIVMDYIQKNQWE